MITLEEAARFHGHLGPFLLLGYLAGSVAVRELRPEDPRDLRARVVVPLKTPYSCIIDGVQASSGCTLGKGNIEVVDGDDFTVEFTYRGRSLKLRIREWVVKECLKLLDEVGMEGAVDWLMGLREGEVFETL